MKRNVCQLYESKGWKAHENKPFQRVVKKETLVSSLLKLPKELIDLILLVWADLLHWEQSLSDRSYRSASNRCCKSLDFVCLASCKIDDSVPRPWHEDSPSFFCESPESYQIAGASMDCGKCKMMPCFERRVENLDASGKSRVHPVSGYIWEDQSKKRLLRFDSSKDSDPLYERPLDDFEYSTLTHHVCAIKACHMSLNCENSKNLFLDSCFFWLIGKDSDRDFQGLAVYSSFQWFLKFRFFELHSNPDRI
jgi:hypothetical protein